MPRAKHGSGVIFAHMEYEEQVIAARRGQIYLIAFFGIGFVAYAIWKLVLLWQGDPDETALGWQVPALLMAMGVAAILVSRWLLMKTRAK